MMPPIFIIYQLQVLLRAIEDLYKYLERKTVEVESVEKHLKSVSAFNHRQIALLSHASRHPGAEYSIASHQESNNVPMRRRVRICWSLRRRVC